MMKLFGISGTNGAGKDTVAQCLEENGYLFVSVSEILRNEAKKQNLPIERKVLNQIGSKWRSQQGLGVLVDKAIEIYRSAGQNYTGLAIASIRNPGELERIHGLGGKVIWVDADPVIRYKRIYSRGRTAEDKKTFEEFVKEEQYEMSHAGDETTLNLSGVRDQADIFLTNNENNIDTFKEHVKLKLDL